LLLVEAFGQGSAMTGSLGPRESSSSSLLAVQYSYSLTPRGRERILPQADRVDADDAAPFLPKASFRERHSALQAPTNDLQESLMAVDATSCTQSPATSGGGSRERDEAVRGRRCPQSPERCRPSALGRRRRGRRQNCSDSAEAILGDLCDIDPGARLDPTLSPWRPCLRSRNVF
jgi:hypothetical protein